MIGKSIRLLFLLAIGWSVAPDARAQAFPPGSWSQTCHGAHWDGEVLVAWCRDRNGADAYTRFDNRMGSGNVSNCNGALVRGDSCANAPSTRIVGGPWRREPCGFGVFEGPVMVVYCYDTPGSSTRLTYDTRQGGGPLARCDGALRPVADCAAPRPASAFPLGNWQETCARARFEGQALVAVCRTNSGAVVRAEYPRRDMPRALFNCDGQLSPDRSCGKAHRGTVDVPGPASATKPVAVAPALPPGDWARSCRNGRFEGHTLHATCARDQRGLREASLEMPDPTAYVTVCDGWLTFGDINQPHDNLCANRYQQLPGGNWERKCRGQTYHDYKLIAECWLPERPRPDAALGTIRRVPAGYVRMELSTRPGPELAKRQVCVDEENETLYFGMPDCGK